MTIQESKKTGRCVGCIFLLVGPGESRCMGTSLGDTDCPGKCASEKREGGGKQ